MSESKTPRTDRAFGLAAGQTLENEETPYECSCKLETELSAALHREKELTSWTDIKASHPLNGGSHETYAEAMRLVGAKRSKYALVDLVNCFLQRAKDAEAENISLRKDKESLREALINESKFRQETERQRSQLESVVERYREAEKALPEEPLCPKLESGKFSCDEYDALVDYIDSLRAHAAALQAEREEIREDAERYRWLRSQYEDRPYAVFAWDDDCAIGNAELDAAIDAARGKK